MSSVVELEATPTEVVNLATAKNFLRLPSASGPDDTLISTIIIPGARRQLETALGLTLVNRQFLQYEDGFPFFPYFQSPYAPLFGAAFPFYFGYGPIASYPYPAQGGLSNQLVAPFEKRLLRSPVTAVDHIEYIGTDGQSHALYPGKDFTVDFSSTPGRVGPLPGQRWPVCTLGMNTVKIYFTAGYMPMGSANTVEMLGAIWEADTPVAQGSYVIDSNANLELQLQANAKTGKNEPTWPANPGATVSEMQENAAISTWKNICPVASIGPWLANHNYTSPVVISDGNGYLWMLIVGSLTSGASAPTFTTNETLGAIANDNSVAAWQNIGEDLTQDAVDPADQVTEFTENLSIPPNLYTAILQLVVHWWGQRAVVVAGGNAGKLPFHLEEIIQSERVLDFST